MIDVIIVDRTKFRVWSSSKLLLLQPPSNFVSWPLCEHIANAKFENTALVNQYSVLVVSNNIEIMNILLAVYLDFFNTDLFNSHAVIIFVYWESKLGIVESEFKPLVKI